MVRPEGIDEHAARDLLARSTDGWLDAAETRELLECYGIAPSPQQVVTEVDEAIRAAGEIGYPVALKANGVLHKTDVGGVRLDLRGPDEVRVAFAALAAITGSVLVQAMARPGLELIVGSTRDEKAGAVVMLGIGGVLSGLIADRSLKITPVTDADADAMIGSLRAKALFDGFRGYAPIDKSAVRDLILRVSRLVSEYPQIAELDLNPVICDGARLTIVDAKVRIGATQPLSDPMTRALSAVPATAH
jgi:succinyl-CoA synthetase beta subunit